MSSRVELRLKLKRNLFWRFWNLPDLIKMFLWKSITKIRIPTFENSSEKVGVGILVIDFQGNLFMRSGRYQNLQNKFLFSLRCNSTIYDIPFQSYDQSKMSKNVTVWHSDPSVTWTSWFTLTLTPHPHRYSELPSPSASFATLLYSDCWHFFKLCDSLKKYTNFVWTNSELGAILTSVITYT